MNIDQVISGVKSFREELSAIKLSESTSGFTWYGYDILANIEFIDGLITDDLRQEISRLGQCRVADIGGADGDLSFLFERYGHEVDLIDWPTTNWNGLRGAWELKRRLDSNVSLHEVDLDSQFVMPNHRYGLVLFLGILYHLKNPFYVLERLARISKYCILSTRVARYAGAPPVLIQDIPIAYLVGPHECNNDATNYWIFSLEGLNRIISRSGWVIRSHHTIGSSESNPSDAGADERAFLFLESHAAL